MEKSIILMVSFLPLLRIYVFVICHVRVKGTDTPTRNEILGMTVEICLTKCSTLRWGRQQQSGPQITAYSLIAPNLRCSSVCL